MINDIDGTILLIGFTFIGVISVITSIIYQNNKKNKKIDTNHVNENSFQNYAKFYGEIIPSENDFNDKLNTILTMIQSGETDIRKIANATNYTEAQVILKIKYLKNKRLLDDYYIDTVNMKLLPCSKEDQILLDKYKPYIYGSHTQIVEFAHMIPNPDRLPFEEHKKRILDELVSLDRKGLLNGVKINDIDGEIIYYTIEKRKTIANMETIHCPNCGSLIDVDKNNKVRCSYCNTIIIGSEYKDEEVIIN